jgi:hypothetical protein
LLFSTSGAHGQDDSSRLIVAMLGDTPIVDDLRTLTQEIGGRATGSESNLKSVDWAMERFAAAGVSAKREPFEMPELWLENGASASVSGQDLGFEAEIVAMPFSTDTPPGGLTAPLLDAGFGTESDFERLGSAAAGAFLLVETHLLKDIEGLFKEYYEAFAIEKRAVGANAAGVVYMSSRAPGNMYRHNSSLQGDEARPMVVMDRIDAQRAMGILRNGLALDLTVDLDLATGGPYESYNVIGEITGSTHPEEIVVIGAHLDAWDLGGGALDNGANVSMLIDMARQMKRLNIRPARTIRFALWNGEEQGLVGSMQYTNTHLDELDNHVVAMSFDIGCGLINGLFTGGRPEILPTVEKALEPVAGLGPFSLIDVPIVGTDNFDFMMQGVANLVGSQEAATYGPNYHAESDQFAECDQHSLKLNGAIAAALTLGLANAEITWDRQTREEVEQLIATTDLEQQMRSFNVWADWEEGSRGRQ